MKNKKGLSLIVVLVTIIVVLIITLIILNITKGNLIDESQTAASSVNANTIKKDAKAEILEVQTKNGGLITNEQIKTILSKYGTIKENDDDTVSLITPEGYIVDVTDLFNTSYI